MGGVQRQRLRSSGADPSTTDATATDPSTTDPSTTDAPSTDRRPRARRPRARRRPRLGAGDDRRRRGRRDGGNAVGHGVHRRPTSPTSAPAGCCPTSTQGPFPTDRPRSSGATSPKARPGCRCGSASRSSTSRALPIPGATVEIWHCDVDGDYSGLRRRRHRRRRRRGHDVPARLAGRQRRRHRRVPHRLAGLVPGRAVHIHAKVHIDDATVLTTQFLFDDELNAEVMATGPYAPYGEPDTTNATDGVTGGSGEADGLLFTVSDDAELSGKRALIVVGLDDATSRLSHSHRGGSGARHSPTRRSRRRGRGRRSARGRRARRPPGSTRSPAGRTRRSADRGRCR